MVKHRKDFLNFWRCTSVTIKVRKYRWGKQNIDNRQHNGHKTKTSKSIHNTICFGYHYAQTNTNDVNKTWLLLQTTDKIWPRMLLTYKITDDVTTKTFLQRQKVVQIWLFVYNSSSRNPHNVLMFSIFPQWKYLGRKAYPNRRHYICFLIILIMITRSVF